MSIIEGDIELLDIIWRFRLGSAQWIVPRGLMSTDQRMTKAIEAAGGKLSIERFSRAGNKAPSEVEMASDLTLFATGLKTPKAF